MALPPVVSLQGLVWHSLFEMENVNTALNTLKDHVNQHMTGACDTKIEDLTEPQLVQRNNFLCDETLNTSRDVLYYTESGYRLA